MLTRNDISKAIDWALLIAVFILMGIAIAGCRSVEYSHDPTGVKVRYVNFGFDTAIGKLTIPTEHGIAELDGLDSKQQVSAALADTAREAIRRVPVPSSATYSAPSDTTAPRSVPALPAPIALPPAGQD